MSKILVVTESSVLNTGYGVVGKNLISTLLEAGHDVVELSLFVEPDDPKLRTIKWPYVVNAPPKDSPQRERFNANRFNLEGMWSFDNTLITVKPDVVIDNRDPFMYQYQALSPFREFFNWLIVAPVDGIPQAHQWQDTFRSADGVFTLTDWGKSVLESNGITVDGVMGHSASKNFKPMSQEEVFRVKDSLGISDFSIVGTVMRNQPRKLFPSLFSGFRKFLDTTGSKSLLYCHTRYPDGGWNIPGLLMDNDITSKVLFTYYCELCKKAHTSFYKDIIGQCPHCKKHSAKLGCVTDGISDNTMNIIFNMFDVYIQAACREGFGIPQAEAAACGVPVVTVDYAGMSDVGKKLNAIMMQPANASLQHGMAMEEASLNPEIICEGIIKGLAVDKFKEQETIRSSFVEHYGSWAKCMQPFVDKIERLEGKKSWASPANISNVPPYQEINCSNSDYVKYLFHVILRRPDLFGGYASTRMTRDLNYGATFGGSHGFYFIESNNNSKTVPFNREAAYRICRDMRENHNTWEGRRVNG